MTYYQEENFKVTSEGYFIKDENKVFSPSRFTGKTEKKIIGSPNILRAFFLFVLGCFVISEATVSGSYFAPIVAYIVGAILIVWSYYSLTYRLIEVRFYFTNGDWGILNFGKNKPADEFIDAIERMSADHKASQNIKTGQ